MVAQSSVRAQQRSLLGTSHHPCRPWRGATLRAPESPPSPDRVGRGARRFGENTQVTRTAEAPRNGGSKGTRETLDSLQWLTLSVLRWYFRWCQEFLKRTLSLGRSNTKEMISHTHVQGPLEGTCCSYLGEDDLGPHYMAGDVFDIHLFTNSQQSHLHCRTSLRRGSTQGGTEKRVLCLSSLFSTKCSPTIPVAMFPYAGKNPCLYK